MKLRSNILNTLGVGVVLAFVSLAAVPAAHADGPPPPIPNVPAAPEPGMVVTGISMLGMVGAGLLRGRLRGKQRKDD